MDEGIAFDRHAVLSELLAFALSMRAACSGCISARAHAKLQSSSNSRKSRNGCNISQPLLADGGHRLQRAERQGKLCGVPLRCCVSAAACASVTKRPEGRARVVDFGDRVPFCKPPKKRSARERNVRRASQPKIQCTRRPLPRCSLYTLRQRRRWRKMALTRSDARCHGHRRNTSAVARAVFAAVPHCVRQHVYGRLRARDPLICSEVAGMHKSNDEKKVDAYI